MDTPPTEESPAVDIACSDVERAQLKGLEDNLRETKLIFADAALAAEAARSQSIKAANDVVQANNAYMQAVEKVAKAHGIDPKNQSVHYQFDAENFVFRKV